VGCEVENFRQKISRNFQKFLYSFWKFPEIANNNSPFSVKARKLAYYGGTTKKRGSCLEKEIMQGTMPDACRRERPHTTWMDNIKTWTGLPVEESIRMTEDGDK